MPSPKRGEVWLADLGPQAGQKPVVILQSEAAEIIDTTVIVPLTTRTEQAIFVTNVSIEAGGDASLTRPHVALCAQLRSIPVDRLQRRMGELSHEQISEIEQRLAFLLGFPT